MLTECTGFRFVRRALLFRTQEIFVANYALVCVLLLTPGASKICVETIQTLHRFYKFSGKSNLFIGKAKISSFVHGTVSVG